jgi:hypothetical protein
MKYMPSLVTVDAVKIHVNAHVTVQAQSPTARAIHHQVRFSDPYRVLRRARHASAQISRSAAGVVFSANLLCQTSFMSSWSRTSLCKA